MPKLWNETVEAHRRAVREAILDAAWALVREQGLTALGMSHIAERAGVSRATLYRYFGDVEAVLIAWHERHVSDHIRELTRVGESAGAGEERLRAVLGAYARIVRNQSRQDAELVALMHRGSHVESAMGQLKSLIAKLLAETAGGGRLRADVPPDELAGYCLHALSAARDLRSEKALERLVSVTLAGLRPD